MPFDYKKEFKDFYLPPAKPHIVHIPKMQFVAVRGKGNPNEKAGEYKSALALQYAIEYTIKQMDSFALNNGWQLDFSTTRLHHEIYLSNPRKTVTERLKTVIRHPVRKSK